MDIQNITLLVPKKSLIEVQGDRISPAEVHQRVNGRTDRGSC